MKFPGREGISPIVATLLLIAIAVAAGIVLYVFANGLAGNLTATGGQQTTERLQMQGYNFVISPPAANSGVACGCSGQVLEIFLLNSGSSTTTISAAYFDGALLSLQSSGGPYSGNTLLSGINNNAYTTPSTTTIGDYATSCSAGTGASAAGSICLTAATTDTSYASGSTGQIIITFSSAATPGTAHIVKVVSTTGATYVFAVTAGRTG